MPQPRASLVEQHAILSEIAERSEFAMRDASERSNRPPRPEREREVFVLNSTVKLLAIMATFEDQSRAFVAGLLKEHGRE